MFHIIIIIIIITIIIIIIEGVHLRDGQDQAQAEGLRGGVAQAQDDQVTTLHREGLELMLMLVMLLMLHASLCTWGHV